MRQKNNPNSKPSYREPATWATTPQISYQKDFKSCGSFKIERDHGQLNCFIGLGKYADGKWSVTTPDFVSAMAMSQFKEGGTREFFGQHTYYLSMHYYHKKNVEIKFTALSNTPEAKATHAYMETVAKKFFLWNELLAKIDFYEWPEERVEPAWGDVTDLIAGAKKKLVDGKNPGASWSKTMTVQQAERLMAYLGIKVKFPR